MTLYQLRRRGWAIANHYCLCNRDEVKINHKYFHYGATCGLLSIIPLLNVSLVQNAAVCIIDYR